MNASVLFLYAVSLGTLLLGLSAWRLTSSRPLVVLVLFASTAFLIAGYGMNTRQLGHLIFVMPYLVTMLLVGRSLGIYWRAYFKGEQHLSAAGHFMGAASAMCLAGTFVAYLNQ